MPVNALRRKKQDRLTVDVALFALVHGAETVAGYLVVVVDALGADEAQVLALVAFVKASLVHVLVLCGHQGCDGQEIRSRLPRTQHYVADAADE